MKRQRIRKGIVIISFLLFPATFYYLSPYIIIDGAFAAVATGSMVMFGLQFLFSLLFGRAFCGWVCPVGGLEECLSLATTKRAKNGKRNWIKYFIWVPWLGFVVTGAVLAGGIHRVDIAYRTVWGFSVSDIYSLIVYFLVVALVTVLALTVGRRTMCHSVCWMAPFMVLGTRLKNALRYPSLRLVSDASKCTRCGQCEKKCPMNLQVSKMVSQGSLRSDECILCAECADSCPGKAISLRWVAAGHTGKNRNYGLDL